MKTVLKISAQYVLALVFAILLILITELAFSVQSRTGIGVGFDFLLVFIIAAIAFSLLLYYFTGTLPAAWKVASYFLTLALWATEQYFITDLFYDFVFRSGFDSYTLIILSSLLWVSNKIIVDAVLTKLSRKQSTGIK